MFFHVSVEEDMTDVFSVVVDRAHELFQNFSRDLACVLFRSCTCRLASCDACHKHKKTQDSSEQALVWIQRPKRLVIAMQFQID